VCLLFVLSFSPRPALAQGPPGTPGGDSNLQARVVALEAAVAKLNGNITTADLAGTYAFYLIGTSIDGPGTVATYNAVSSYVIKGTVTLTATIATGGTGTIDGVIEGVQMLEQSAAANWTWGASPIGGIPQSTTLTWTYDSGTRTLSVEPNAGFNAFDLSVAAGGQVLVSATGGTPSNNQQLLVLTRK
jgi:hypothetical protein